MSAQLPPTPIAAPIIAIVGLCGVGKSQVTRYVEAKHHFTTVYFGGQITGEVARRGLAVNPENERAVREELRAKHGMAAVAILAHREISEKIAAGHNVVIDGIYSYAELTYLREALKQNIISIAVHSPKRYRYERMEHRDVRPLTAAQVDERDMHEVNALDKATPIALADYHIVNDSSLTDLEAAIDRTLSQFLG